MGRGRKNLGSYSERVPGAGLGYRPDKALRRCELTCFLFWIKLGKIRTWMAMGGDMVSKRMSQNISLVMMTTTGMMTTGWRNGRGDVRRMV